MTDISRSTLSLSLLCLLSVHLEWDMRFMFTSLMEENINMSQLKLPITFILWRSWWYRLRTENFILHQKALHLSQEIPLSTEAYKQPPTPQSYPWRGRDWISTTNKTHPSEHKTTPKEFITNFAAQSDNFDQEHWTL